MKSISNALIVLVAFPLLYARPLMGLDKWTPAQLEALALLQASCDAEVHGSVEELRPLFHKQFVAWDLAKNSPVHLAAHLQTEAEFMKEYDVVGFDITPTAIEVAGDTAVVHVTYSATSLSQTGERLTMKGRWSATLVREGSKWLFLSCTWDLTE